jgi:hypothetical protein
MHALRTAAGTATGAGFLGDPDYLYRGARSAAGASAARFVPRRFGALRAGEQFHQVDLLTTRCIQQNTVVY